MRVISVHVPEEPYQDLKAMARRRKVPVARLLREAMNSYLSAQKRTGVSVIDLPPLNGGGMKEGWTRSEVFDEMIGR